MKNFFSIVIASKNEGFLIKKTIDGLLADKAYISYEIIIVDDGSVDKSLEFLKDKIYSNKVKLIQNKKTGIARARNLGAKYAKSDVLIFIDAHMKFSLGWLEKINQTLQSKKISILGIDCKNYNLAKVKADRNYYYLYLNRDLSMIGSVFKKRIKKKNKLKRVPFINGNCLIVRKDVFQKIGGFLDILYGWGLEDKLFCLQAYLYGYDSFINPSITIYHIKKDPTVNQKLKFAVYNSLVGAYIFYPKKLFDKTKQLLRKQSNRLVFGFNQNLFLKNINKIKRLKLKIKKKSSRRYRNFIQDYQYINN